MVAVLDLSYLHGGGHNSCPTTESKIQSNLMDSWGYQDFYIILAKIVTKAPLSCDTKCNTLYACQLSV